MEQVRKLSNDATINFLENWTEAQKTTERLAGAILRLENYTEIEPSHPTGGRDTGKDIVCRKDDKSFIAAVSFNRDKQSFTSIKRKFSQDLKSATKHKPGGFIYFTNQRLTIKEKETLSNIANKEISVVLYSLETIAGILSTPSGYGVRLEYLGLEMTKTEQLSFFSVREKELNKLNSKLKELLTFLENNAGINTIPIDKLNEFKSTLEMIIGNPNNLYGYGNSMIEKLKIPLPELREFMQELNILLSGYGFSSPLERLKVPVEDLRKYRELLNQILNLDNLSFIRETPNKRLAVPLDDLIKYSELLNQILNLDNLSFPRETPNKKLSVPVEHISTYYQTLLDIKSLRIGYPDLFNLPISELENYNSTLNSTIAKLNEINKLKSLIDS